MLDNGRNTDVIEVLELKDIKGGWVKIDYVKTALFDLQYGSNSVDWKCEAKTYLISSMEVYKEVEYLN